MPDTTVCDAYFNSRPHGGRQNIVFLFLFTRHFNSRPHGGRHAFSCFTICRSSFQLTPSRRATPACGSAIGSIEKFQLTPSRRATIFIASSTSRLVFQLTPSRRATSSSSLISLLIDISTHALTEGDHTPFYIPPYQHIFQLTPSRRATANLDKFFF